MKFPTTRQIEMFQRVVNRNESIKAVAADLGVHPSTVRRGLDVSGDAVSQLTAAIEDFRQQFADSINSIDLMGTVEGTVTAAKAHGADHARLLLAEKLERITGTIA